MNALDQLQQAKSWLGQADEKTIDAFAGQHTALVHLFAETLLNFRRGIENVKIIMPTERTTVQNRVPSIQLENAKQDEPYFCKPNNDVLIKEIRFLQTCGLSWNADQKVVEGTPTISGEVQLSFLLEEGATALGTLWINPNPKKLWNNISSDQNDRFWKVDSASDEISTKFGKLLAARMRGRSHAHKGTCCDDDFAMTFHEKSGVHFIAVADGAGSAEFSRFGSKLAVEAAKEKVLEQLEQNEKYQAIAAVSEMEKLKGIANGLLFQAVQAAFFAQERQAEKEQIPVKSLSCTLLLALTLPLENNQWFTAGYWIGDGAVAILDLGFPKVKLLGEVDTGSYSGETLFLNRAEIEPKKLISRIYTDLQDYAPILMLMTDGVSDPKFKTDAKLQSIAAWQDLWSELKSPLQAENPAKTLEQWLDFWSKGEHDDRTLAMFIPKSEWDGLVNQQQSLTVCETNERGLLANEPIDSVQKNTEEKVLENGEREAQDTAKNGIEDKGERTINVTHNNITTTITLSKASDRVLDNQGVNQ
ncbi:serine/threonine protein phosphatase [Rodentibacter rarus]|uniref:Serine/threonine protein phosphatase n=1 Tax=Rodentibacter rarus TaxID=1908260 RepID=A0A1V3ITA6_9PAST|nr:PP2C family serine/threonine-protein phosphatase [Rodentibacter rarus]OOF45149.1 serine/threonine protein phosphatase [Rodentibacter rarus]